MGHWQGDSLGLVWDMPLVVGEIVLMVIAVAALTVVTECYIL